MAVFSLQILEATSEFYDGECDSLIVPTTTGLYGILAGHSNAVLALEPGRMQYRVPGDKEFKAAAVSGGIVKVEDGKVLVLADSCERPEEIDMNRARREADEAREKMLQKRSAREYHEAQAQLARAMNRIKVHDSLQ